MHNVVLYGRKKLAGVLITQKSAIVSYNETENQSLLLSDLSKHLLNVFIYV